MDHVGVSYSQTCEAETSCEQIDCVADDHVCCVLLQQQRAMLKAYGGYHVEVVLSLSISFDLDFLHLSCDEQRHMIVERVDASRDCCSGSHDDGFVAD